jgi:hypothetical protein
MAWLVVVDAASCEEWQQDGEQVRERESTSSRELP